MEEVIGSIPIRSTNHFNNLDNAIALGKSVCVMVCVITPHFAACCEGFHRCALRFHADVRVPKPRTALSTTHWETETSICSTRWPDLPAPFTTAWRTLATN